LLAGLSKEFSMLKSLVSLNNRLAGLRSDDRGVTSVEYGLMVALIAVVIIGAVTLLGTNLSTLFNDVAGAI
jgi:pilus assembly protein Flp/PilA